LIAAINNDHVQTTETVRMHMSDRAAIILAVSILLAGFLSAGIYRVVPGNGQNAFRLNVWTGAVDRCSAFRCGD